MRIPAAFRHERRHEWRAIFAIASCALVLSCDLFESKKSTPPEEPAPPAVVVDAPTISPKAGDTVSTSPIEVVIASPASGAWVCWTLDGTDPVDGGRCADSARFVLDTSAQVKARAYHADQTPSMIVSARYVIELPRMSTPRLVPDSGFFDSAIAISLASIDASYGSGREFHYTTDGTEPTLHSARYEGPFRLGHDAIVKARQWGPGRIPSDVVSGRFRFSRSFDLSGTPVIAPRDATFDTSVVVVIEPPHAGCDIRYTTDSTEPTQWSRQSFGQILLERSARVKARAWCQDMYGNVLEPGATDSSDITIRYKPAIAPVFSPKAGTYDSVQYVSLSSATPGASIHYTIDGREPSLSSALYRGSITLRSTTTVKAAAFAADRPASTVVSATFTLRNVPTSGKPVISGVKESSSSWSGDTVIRVSIKGPSLSGTVLRYTLDGSVPTESSPIYRESFVVDGARTVKARSFRRGMLESAIDSQRFEPRLSRALAPTFSPDPAKYSPDSVQYIYLSTKTPGCQIRYTLDGSTPTSSSMLYAGSPITLTGKTTIKAVALAPSREASPVASATWDLSPLPAAAVKITTTATVDSATKVYTTIVPVLMSTATADAVIRYTLDGTEPQESSPAISGLLTLESSDTVKARAFCRGLLPGPVATMIVPIRLEPCASVVIADSLSGPGGYRTVRLSTSTDSAQIWYGHGDGAATPYQYQSPFRLTSTTKIHAVAHKYGRSESKLAAREIKVTLPQVPKPVISPRDTTAKDVVRASISDSLPGATIWYSRYGYDRTRCSAAFDVEDSVTRIIAWAEAPGYARSANDTVEIRVALPSAGGVRHLLAQGIYGSVQYDTIEADSNSAAVWVSIDDGSYRQYPEGRAVVRLDHYVRVRAYATMPHRLKGAVATAWYDIRLPKAAKPTISPRGGFSDTVLKATISTDDSLATWYRIGYGSASAYRKGQVLSFSSNTTLTAWNTGADKLQSDADSVSWTIQLRPVDTLLADKSAGYYDTGLVVKLATATKGATIWARLDPANGASGSGALRALDSTGSLRVDSSAILYAYATAGGRAPSNPILIRYDVRRYTAPSPVAKTDSLGRLILSSTLPGAQIFYQVNAGSVRVASSGSTLPLGVGTNVVTSWIAKPGWQSSPLRVDEIRLAPSAPAISPDGGLQVPGSVVSLSSPDGLPIRYTLDGETPTQSSLLWSRNLVLADSVFGKGDSLVLSARVWADSIPSATARVVFRRMGQVASVVASIPDTAKLDTGAVVILRTATKGAAIWWRFKGMGDYQGGMDTVRIPLDSSLSIEAYASKTDMLSCAVSTFSWKIPRYGVATPVISPRTGAIKDSSSVQVSISTGTPKAQIHYMLNAAGPYAYSAPFRIEKNSVITAYATRPGWNTSALDSVYISFDTTVSAPKFSPASGIIASGTKVAISGPSGAIIRYTLDGRDPDGESPVYQTPISINVDSVVLKARAWVGSRSSEVSTARYTLIKTVKFNVWMKPHGGTFTDSVAVAISCGGCSDTTILFSSFGRDTIEALANAKVQNPAAKMMIRSSGKAWLLLLGAKSKTLLSWDSASFMIGKARDKAAMPTLRSDTSVVKDGNIVSFLDSARIHATLGGRGDRVAYKDMCSDTTWGHYASGSVKFSTIGSCVVKFWTTSDSLATSDTVRVTLVGMSGVVSVPRFSPSSGSIQPGTKVSITGPSGATIRYTLDGSEPTSSSILYGSPISINVDSTMLKARAWVGGRSSEVATARYTLQRYGLWMKPHGGAFTDSVAVSISCGGCSDTTLLFSSFGRDTAEALANAKAQDPSAKMMVRSSGTAWLLLLGAKSKSVLAWDSAAFSIGKAGLPVLMRDSLAIRNGDRIVFADSVRIRTTPGQGGARVMYKDFCVEGAPATVSTGGVTFSRMDTCDVKFWTTNDGIWSDTLRITLLGSRGAVAAPRFSPSSGKILPGTKVSIAGPTGATIRYTFDGSEPSTSSPVYASPISINVDSTVLKARAWVGGRAGEVSTARYTLLRYGVRMNPHGGTFTDSAIAAISCSGCSDTTILYSSLGRTQEEALANAKVQNPSANMMISSTGKAWLLLMGAKSRSVLAWDSASFSIVPKIAPPTLVRDSNTALRSGDSVKFRDSVRIVATLGAGGDQLLYNSSCNYGSASTLKGALVMYPDTGICRVDFWTSNGKEKSVPVHVFVVPLNVQKPVFTPASGSTLKAGDLVSIHSYGEIHYTFDGSDPTLASPVYQSPVSINADSAVLKARAWSDGGRTSDVATARYFLAAPVKPVKPMVRRDTGNALKTEAYVEFHDSVRLYTEPEVKTDTVWYLNTCSYPQKPEISNGLFMIRDLGSCPIFVYTRAGGVSSDSIRLILRGIKTATKPVLTPAPGLFNDSVRISISQAQGAKIAYSIGGGAMMAYSAPFLVTKNSSVRVRATLNGTDSSDAVTGDYKVQATVKPQAPSVVRMDNGTILVNGAIVKYNDSISLMATPKMDVDTVAGYYRCGSTVGYSNGYIHYYGPKTCQVEFYARSPQGISSDTVKLSVQGSLSSPVFRGNIPGNYLDSARVRIESRVMGNVIYSVDGGAWVPFIDPFLLRKSSTIRARTVQGADSSGIELGDFTIVPSPQDTTLSSLAVTSGRLTPSFQKSVLAYQDTITTDTTTIMMTATDAAASKIWIDGVLQTPIYGQQSAFRVSLAERQSRIVRIVVRSSDNDSLVYTVNVYRKPAEIPWNSAISYGTLNDARDGKTYRTVLISGKTWMAENLSYAGAGACFNSSADSCAKYGRLYTWAEVMAGAGSSTSSPSGVQGICPERWHVPSDGEWDTLVMATGGSSAAGIKLKSTSGWSSSGNGTDLYGFRVLPASYVNDDLLVDPGNHGAFFWSTSEGDATNAWYRYFGHGYTAVNRYNSLKSYEFSLRCIADYVPAPQDTTLSYLKVSSGTLLPAFNSSVLAYTDTITAASTTIRAMERNETGADVWIDGVNQKSLVVSLEEGQARNVRVVVKSSRDSLVYTVNVYRKPTAVEIPWNEAVTYGTLNDARDGKSYRTVKIGDLTWMAENLNYKDPGADSGWAYNNSLDSAAKYGRLYTWSAAMAGAGSSKASPSGVRGICPDKWHVPSDAEWDSLANVVGGVAAGSVLKSTGGWGSREGTDVVGFRALPGGMYFPNSVFSSINRNGNWWSASEHISGLSWYRSLDSGSEYLTRTNIYPNIGFSLRCVADYVPAPLDTTLSSLAVTSGTLSPTFSPSVLAYVDTITTASTTITAMERNETGADVWIDGVNQKSLVVSLEEGQARKVRVVVKSSLDSLVYTVNVVRKATVDPAAPIPWNDAITYGTLPDSRDGKTYRTVQIGGKSWMAENLNYAGTGVCYNGSADSCAKYGRLYTWAEVMAGASSSTSSPSGVQGICPEGWHVPSDFEWQALEVASGMTSSEASSFAWRGGEREPSSSLPLGGMTPGDNQAMVRMRSAYEFCLRAASMKTVIALLVTALSSGRHPSKMRLSPGAISSIANTLGWDASITPRPTFIPCAVPKTSCDLT